MDGLEFINEEEFVPGLLESHAILAFYLKNVFVISEFTLSWIYLHDFALSFGLRNIVKKVLRILLHDDILKLGYIIVV
jgi:hypothetical protein